MDTGRAVSLTICTPYVSFSAARIAGLCTANSVAANANTAITATTVTTDARRRRLPAGVRRLNLWPAGGLGQLGSGCQPAEVSSVLVAGAILQVAPTPRSAVWSAHRLSSRVLVTVTPRTELPDLGATERASSRQIRALHLSGHRQLGLRSGALTHRFVSPDREGRGHARASLNRPARCGVVS
jgi:hypothetical protein